MMIMMVVVVVVVVILLLLLLPPMIMMILLLMITIRVMIIMMPMTMVMGAESTSDSPALVFRVPQVQHWINLLLFQFVIHDFFVRVD